MGLLSIRSTVAVTAVAALGFCADTLAAPGDLDPSFDGDGRVVTDWNGSGSEDRATGVAVQPDGKVLVVGTAETAAVALRYKPDGSPDESFGSGTGRTVIPGGSTFLTPTSVAIQPDGKIVVAGYASGPDVGNDFFVARLLPGGELDPEFGDGGMALTPFETSMTLSNDIAQDVAVMADGRIVAGGTQGIGGNFAVARYEADGDPDLTFSTDGKQTTDFGNAQDRAFGLALRADGRIVLAGQTGGTDGVFAVAGYETDGDPDASFSGDGKLTTAVGTDSGAQDVIVQPDGKVVTAGVSDGRFAFVRYLAGGERDDDFGTSGIVTTSFGNGVSRAALQADGRLVAIGSEGEDFALARYMPDGSPDTTFGSGGSRVTDFGGMDFGFDVALAPDGKIVTAGVAKLGTNFDFAVARHQAAFPAGTTPPGSDPPTGPGPDLLAPVFTSAPRVIPAAFFAPRRKGPSLIHPAATDARIRRGSAPVAPAATGARVRYALSEPAAVTFTAQRKAAGRRRGARCERPSRRNRGGRRCTRWVRRAGSFTHAGAAGANTLRFTGRLRQRPLRPGAYRLVARAVDAAGNKSAAAYARFRIRARR